MKLTEPITTHLVRNELNRFLTSDTPEVLCIRGKWGAGKTYAWNEALREAKRTKKIALQSYSYVSLFGLSTLDEFKYTIFQNRTSKTNIGAEANIETFGKVLDKGMKATLSSIAGSGLSDAVQAGTFLTIRNQIICIDDIERKGTSLRLADLMGLISLLREGRGCKVVIILNDEQLEKPDLDAFNRFQEKVIDISLVYSPTVAECIDIALQDTSVSDKTMFADYCMRMRIKNIRVIKKIARLLDQVTPFVSSLDPLLTKQVIQTITLFGSIHFSRESYSNDAFIHHILNRSTAIVESNDDNPLSAQQMLWEEQLNEYDFGEPDELDIVYLNGVQNGFFDFQEIKRLASDVNLNVERENARRELRASWRMLHDSLEDNVDAVIANVTSAFEKNVDHVSVRGLHDTMSILKRLDHEEDALRLLALFMQREEGSEFYNLEHQHFVPRNQLDPDFVKAFDERFASFKDERSPTSLWIKSVDQRYCSPGDLALLDSLSYEDIYSLIKHATENDIHRSVHFARYLRDEAPQSPTVKKLAAYAISAIQNIAGESKLNAIRLAKYNVTPTSVA